MAAKPLILFASALVLASCSQAEPAPADPDAVRAPPSFAEPRHATNGPHHRVAQRAPVVIELFTSQGCSSCPPADALVHELASDPALVVITRPVTYWDQLGWPDTQARPENTELQRAYATRTLSGKNGVYTPQIVVDGRAGVIGSRHNEVARLVAEARANAAEGPAAAILKATKTSDGGYQVAVDGTARNTARLLLVGLDAGETVAIGRGENSGRMITYTNVYRGEVALGAWNGGAKRFAVPMEALQMQGANRFALILRDGRDGPILAGRML